MIDWALMTGATRLVLVRHGEPEVDSHGRCYGRLDVGLSPRGREQAAHTARWLAAAPLQAIYSSPRRRALESAAPFASARGLTVQLREGLREIDFGSLEGLTYDEARAQHPEFYAAWMAHPTRVTFPGGESYARLRERVLGEARELVRAHAGGTVAVVAHGGVTRAILAEALHLADDDLFRLDQAYASASIIDYFASTVLVRLVNGTPGP